MNFFTTQATSPNTGFVAHSVRLNASHFTKLGDVICHCKHKRLREVYL